ncbi:peptidase domain-containing ABC transporter [Vibrio caribbeanicus]|uniref:peptidase domain-containing ABC transporter n=1 Tax=Vibrio caribbeanicus TaxID=701175 RepID=UPI0030D7F8B2
MTVEITDHTNKEIVNKLNFSFTNKVPIITQNQISECGLACLSMIATYHGLKASIQSFRHNLLIGSHGLSLKELMDISGKVGFTSRPVQCEISEMKELKLPCIVHWGMDHFVVLTQVKNNSVTIHDPAIGKTTLTIAEVGDMFTGIALELMPNNNFKKNDIRETLKINQLWEKITGIKVALLSLFMLSLTLQSFSIISPYYMQWVIDKVLISNDQNLLVILAIGFFLIAVIKVCIGSFRSWLVLKFSATLSIQMIANLFNHMIKLPIKYFEQRHVGDVVSRFNSINAIKELLTTGIIEAVIDGFMAVTILIMMLLYSFKLTAFVLLFVVISFLIQWIFYYPERRLELKKIIENAQEDTIFLESIRAIQTIKVFGNETKRQAIWLNQFAKITNLEIKSSKLNILETSIDSVLAALENILILYLGALMVIDGNLTVGMLLAFIAYKGQFINSIDSFISHIFSFKILGVQLERLSDIALETKENFSNPHSSIDRDEVNIAFQNVCFRYSDGSNWVCKNLTMTINNGESVAITGRSGCGKSTIVKLLLNLLQPSSGAIYLNGSKINELAIDEYRNIFGCVLQNDSLMSGTLIENITMFDEDYDQNWLIECCKIACIWDDIRNLPMGLNSMVGDMGNCFSGGQLQRIYLARALYKKPKVLCLDESTSHLDLAYEKEVNDNLSRLPITKIFIAHRKETINSADRVINID